MTLVAGVLALSESGEVPDSLAHSVVAAISRNRRRGLSVFRRQGAFVVKTDIGAFPGSGEHEDADDALSLLCGDPQLTSSLGGDRQAELRQLHRHCLDQDWQRFADCAGVYSLVHLTSDCRTLVLVADHLSIRPLYYASTPDWFFFSSAFRILQGLPGLPTSADVRGLAEFATLGYSLGARTPIAEVSRMQPAEVLIVKRAEPARSTRYFCWDRASDATLHQTDALEQAAFTHFRNAIARRLGTNRSAVAFLSGGLDSRAIVSLLREHESDVFTFNFSVVGGQDEVYARLFAKAAGTTHCTIPRTEPASLWDADWSRLLRSALAVCGGGDWAYDKPVVAWSGDGGSVCVGGVYLSDTLEGYFSGGDVHEAGQGFAPPLPVGVLSASQKVELRNLIAEGVVEELVKIDVADPIRRFYLFLLFNDQRRHLDGHFENIDLHEIELQLPFFDSRFLKELLRVPAGELRHHRFYNGWMRHFPPSTRAVPWQSYPGHLPCPIQTDAHLPNQWETRPSPGLVLIDRNVRRRRLRRLVEMTFSTDFPTQLIDRKRLLGAGIAFASRLRDYGYVIDFAYSVFRHARHVDRVPSWVGAGVPRHLASDNGHSSGR